jgi:RNA recognition motif-containing protein
MAQKLYVGNLPFNVTEDDVRQLFEQYGPVKSVSLINDRETGRPRGFGFVEMEDAGANAAKEALDGSDFQGRALKVNEARERERSGPPGRGGGGGGGGGGGRGGRPYGGGGQYGGPRGGGHRGGHDE